MATRSMMEVLTGTKEERLVNQAGTPLVTYEEQLKVGQKGINEHWDDKRLGADLGIRKMNPDGTIAKSWVTTAAINEDRFYDNRYRVVEGELFIVTAQTSDGYRAISEQSRGTIFAKHIPVLVFGRKDKALAYLRTEMVSDTDFIGYYTHKLDKEAMKQLLPLIPSGGDDIPEGKLPI